MSCSRRVTNGIARANLLTGFVWKNAMRRENQNKIEEMQLGDLLFQPYVLNLSRIEF